MQLEIQLKLFAFHGVQIPLATYLEYYMIFLGLFGALSGLT